MTLKRLSVFGPPWIITGSSLKVLTELNLAATQVASGEILYEPQGRNTAAAIALLCRHLQSQGKGEEIVGVFPSDHLVTKEREFAKAVRLAESLARDGKIVTLGIKPDHPETGFGYIQTQSTAVKSSDGLEAFAVQGFHEKPQREKAIEFLRQGSFFWNAGIFIFKVNEMARLLEKFEPAVWEPLNALKADLSNLAGIYEKMKSISIDYAVAEKMGGSGQLICVPADIGWSDVGSWDAVAIEARRRGQSSRGADVRSVQSKDVYVDAPKGKTVALIGVEGLNVIDTGDALLISKVGESQRVKDVVEPLAKEKNSVVTEHPYEERPWGRFEILRDTDHFKSKVIVVNAHQQISYQSHAKREEHWIVTKGEGEVVLNDAIIPVKGGTYVHIPLGAKHRIRNTSDRPLEFVEVQLGSYFGEDDIVRYQDDYKRS